MRKTGGMLALPVTTRKAQYNSEFAYIATAKTRVANDETARMLHAVAAIPATDVGGGILETLGGVVTKVASSLVTFDGIVAGVVVAVRIVEEVADVLVAEDLPASVLVTLQLGFAVSRSRGLDLRQTRRVSTQLAYLDCLEVSGDGELFAHGGGQLLGDDGVDDSAQESRAGFAGGNVCSIPTLRVERERVCAVWNLRDHRFDGFVSMEWVFSMLASCVAVYFATLADESTKQNESVAPSAVAFMVVEYSERSFYHEAHKRLKSSPPVRAPIVSASSKPRVEAIIRIKAYHVSSEEDLTFIEPSICDSEFRDGNLYGASAACFTTTTWRGNLPTISPYPRGSAIDSDGYRYTMEFDPSVYYKFQMANTEEKGVTQVHFLLLARDNRRESAIAMFLQSCSFKESFQWNVYFPHGHANDSTSSRIFVNVIFWYTVNVTFEGHVKKRGPMLPYFEVPERGEWWFEQLFQTIPEEKTKYLQQKASAAARRRKILIAAKIILTRLEEEEEEKKEPNLYEEKQEQKEKRASTAKEKLEDEEEEKKKESDLDEEKAEVPEPDAEQKATNEDPDLKLRLDKLSIRTQQT